MTPNRLACAISIVGLLCAPAGVLAQSVTGDKAGGAGMLPLPPTIPIFPLQDVMLFPNISRPLLIFEPRYRTMVADALKGDRIIGMVLLRAGYEAEYEGRPPIYPIGCAGVITASEQLPDGRYVMVLRGLVKFRVTSEDRTRPYRLAHVEAMPELPSDEERAALRRQRPRLTALLAKAVEPGSEPPSPDLPDEDLVNGLAQQLDLDPVERQELLEQKGLLSRSQALIDLLEARVTPPR
jgi:Lon protease-like protein